MRASRFFERFWFALAAVALLQMIAAIAGVQVFGPWYMLGAASFLFFGLGYGRRHFRSYEKWLNLRAGRQANG